MTESGQPFPGGPDLVLEGRFGSADERRYHLVPFSVPPGCRQLAIAYSYTDRIDSDPLAGGGNTLDIGLFDPRGTETGTPGFRGWSGSHKDAFVVGQDWATPPYAAGPIADGTWNVLLGPYKVGPRGCEYRVEIRLDPCLPPLERDLVRTGVPVRPVLPQARDGWLRGDLHCHTRYSDGDSWPSEMLHAAAEAGLDFLGATDHNNVAHHADYGPGGGPLPIVVPGVEVTTYGGHWNAWGTDRWWEFRDPDAAAVERAMREAAASGAFVSVNHAKPFGPPWEYPTARGFHAVEVWNGSWVGLNSVALTFWEDRLRAGERLVAVGGSDTHLLRSDDPDVRHSRAPGNPTTWVDAGGGADATAILRGMREGRTFVSASPAGPQLYLDEADGQILVAVEDGAGTALLLIGDNGTIDARSVDSASWSTSCALPGSSGYVRAQLVRPTGEVVALTSPIWLG
ncbi:MAG: PHP domain-containing protein [Chloroflexi bacterium]|nr:PHP domain-containing protein [Chloroflexota bacterium]